MSTKPDWRAPCEVCGLYELGEHFDQAGDWCDGAGARLVTPTMLVAALIAEGGEIEQAFEEPYYEGDTFAAVEVHGGPGRYLVYGPIPVESAEAKETPR